MRMQLMHGCSDRFVLFTHHASLRLFVFRLQRLGAFTAGGLFPSADRSDGPLPTHQPPAQPLRLGEHSTPPASSPHARAQPDATQTGESTHTSRLWSRPVCITYGVIWQMCLSLWFLAVNATCSLHGTHVSMPRPPASWHQIILFIPLLPTNIL